MNHHPSKQLLEKTYKCQPKSYWHFVNRSLIGIVCVTGLFIYSVVDDLHSEFNLPFAFFALLMWGLPFLTYMKLKREKVTISSVGIEVDKIGFRPWSEVKMVKQEPFKEAGPYRTFFPGYVIHFADSKSYKVHQTVEGYTELYRQLYLRKIPGTERALYLYDTTVEGENGAWDFLCDSVYYPDKDVIKKEKLKPV